MPKKILDLDTPFRRNERVVTTTDLVGAPEGTYGKVKLSNGLHTTNNWPRYWVRFDNGAHSRLPVAPVVIGDSSFPVVVVGRHGTAPL